MNVALHLVRDAWTVTVKDYGAGTATWIEFADGEGNCLGLFGTREDFGIIRDRLENFVGSRKKGEIVMAKRTPSYIVNTAVDVEDGKTRWREIGVGFTNDGKDTITLLLDALPVSGKLVLTRPKAKDTPEPRREE